MKYTDMHEQKSIVVVNVMKFSVNIMQLLWSVL